MNRRLGWGAAGLGAVALAVWLWPRGAAPVLDAEDGAKEPAPGGAEAASRRPPPSRAPGPQGGAEANESSRPPAHGEAADAATPVAAAAAGPDGGVSQRAAISAWLERNAALAEKNVDEFCDEAKALKRDPPGPIDRTEHDASSFLTVRIDWEDHVRPPGLLHLPEPLRARLRAYGAGWPAAIRDDDLASLDFSWMTVIHQFDHWNLMAEGPLRDSRNNDFYDAPIPNFVELQLWTKLRFARALRLHDFAAASADVHQLVALLRTTGLLVAEMVGISLLNLERAGLEAAVALGLEVPPGLAYDAAETAGERRLNRVAMYFFYPGVSEKVMKKALGCNAHWKCSALFEGLGAHTTLAGLAPSDTTATISALADGSGCNPQLLKWIHDATPRTPASALEALGPDQPFDRLFASGAGR